MHPLSLKSASQMRVALFTSYWHTQHGSALIVNKGINNVLKYNRNDQTVTVLVNSSGKREKLSQEIRFRHIDEGIVLHCIDFW